MPDTTISDALRATSLITTALMSAKHPDTQKFTEAIDAVNALRSYFGAARDLAAAPSPEQPEHEEAPCYCAETSTRNCPRHGQGETMPEHEDCEHDPGCEHRNQAVVGGHEEARRLSAFAHVIENLHDNHVLADAEYSVLSGYLRGTEAQLLKAERELEGCQRESDERAAKWAKAEQKRDALRAELAIEKETAADWFGLHGEMLDAKVVAERQLEDALEAGRALEEQRNVAVREVGRLRQHIQDVCEDYANMIPCCERDAAGEMLNDMRSGLSADTQRES